ncbi:MAG: heat-inducible transcriptional repressor HrcA [Eubacteriales bacterium]|nr:heat-inducible transcriptional repressor HrcA [Eubacteriales bacterium]
MSLSQNQLNRSRDLALQLTDRQRRILKAIVETYIAEAEPVGSKSLLASQNWQISSATVRKEMADLENAGFLEQPHTSAGRVPTDLGYRVYVDDLLTPYQLQAAERASLHSFLDENLRELESTLRAAAHSLSVVTGLTAMVLLPQYEASELRHLHLILIEAGRALCVMVLSSGIVKDFLLELAPTLGKEEVEALAKALEEGLAGQRLSEISAEEIASSLFLLQLEDGQAEQVVKAVMSGIQAAQNLEIYVEGEHLLLQQPEFQDPERANLTFSEFRNPGGLLTYLEPHEESLLPLVKIGQELAFAGLSDLSLIAANYSKGNNLRGQIAVIGPRRMAYSSIISKIKYLQQSLSRSRPELAKEDLDVEEEA